MVWLEALEKVLLIITNGKTWREGMIYGAHTAAASDSGGGAWIQAVIKTFAALSVSGSNKALFPHSIVILFTQPLLDEPGFNKNKGEK